MKLQVTQENLNKALASVAKVANARGTLPILANVLIKTVGNRLSISATDLNIAITHFIGSKINQEGSITVPARLMQDFISNLPPAVIDLELSENKLNISTDQYQSVINGIVADEFPVMPQVKGGMKMTVPGDKLKIALQQVIFAASNDDARPILTGVYIHDLEGTLYIVATDSYRLAERKLSTSKQIAKLLIPANALNDLLRVMGDTSEDVNVEYDEQQVMFRVGDIELVARLIEGNYPDYRKLIPTNFSTIASLKRSELLSITKVSSLFARESAGSITVNVDGDKNSVSIHSIASQLGENTSSAIAKIKGGGNITLNSRYLLDALNNLVSENVDLCFNGKLEPILIKDPSSTEYLQVIMPLKS